MKQAIIYTTIITLLFSIAFVIIINDYKHEVPTDEEWNEYLTCESELQHDSNEGKDVYNYTIQNRDTNEVYFTGSLADCKLYLEDYEYTYGECVIMPNGSGEYRAVIE